jgi:tRNA-dihydrouridine synthase
MKSFWDSLPQPFFALAPLANVTDAAFRRVIAKYSKPMGQAATPESKFVMWTEFVSADGLMKATPEGKAKLMRDLIFTEAERPIVAQLFTSNPETMEQAARLCQELGFDGVDINMGCPDKSIEKQGAGAKLITTPEVAAEVIRAAKRGADKIPVSVKTRLGYNKDVLDEWLPVILKEEPAAVTIHARTRKEMSKVPAHWERVKRAVEIRNEMKSGALILGNGDALDIEDARKKAAESGADGVMLGRAIFGRPWLFAQTSIAYTSENSSGSPQNFLQHALSSSQAPQQNPVAEPATSEGFAQALPIETRLGILVEHTKLFEELLGDIKSFAIMKKHFKAYVEGFDGAKELRVKLMETNSAAEVESHVHEFLLARR